MRKQRRRSAAQLISAFVYTTRIIQALYYLNPKFQASSHILWLYSPVSVGPGRKTRRLVFSQRGSFTVMALSTAILRSINLVNSTGKDFGVIPVINEPRCEKTGLRVSDQVRLKPGCTATEDG